MVSPHAQTSHPAPASPLAAAAAAGTNHLAAPDEREQRTRACEAPGGSGSRSRGDTPVQLWDSHKPRRVLDRDTRELRLAARLPPAGSRRWSRGCHLLARGARFFRWQPGAVRASGSRTRLRDARRPLVRSEQDSCAAVRGRLVADDAWGRSQARLWTTSPKLDAQTDAHRPVAGIAKRHRDVVAYEVWRRRPRSAAA
jgi:hypothetical protein